MTPTISQKCIRAVEPTRLGKRHVHAEQAGDHGQRTEQRGDDRQQARHVGQAIRDAREVRVENAGHPVLEHDGIVRDARELVVDVTEPVGHLLVDDARTRGAPAGRRRRAAARRCGAASEMSRLTARMSPIRPLVARLDDGLLDLVEPILELVGFGTVVVDHRVDDAMEQGHRAFRENVTGALAELGDVGDAAPLPVVNRHQIVRAQEEVRFVRVEQVLARPGN